MRDELDPQATAALKQLGQILAPLRTATDRVAAARSALKSMGPLGFPREDVASASDFEIAGSTAPIPCRLYTPAGEEHGNAILPILIYYHGGAFIAGDLDSYDTLMRAIANRAGCLVVSVAYRLAPENPYPAANDDCWDALTWIAANASRFRGDSQRIAVGGDSAGGLLAAWVAQKARALGRRLRLQILLYPSLDATMSSASWQELGSGAYGLSLHGVRKSFDDYLPDHIDRRDPRVSPAFALDLAGLAPAFVVTADHDPLRDEGDDYANRLTAAGIPTTHIRWPGMIHGFASLAGVVDAGRRLIEQTAEVIRLACR